MRKRVWVVEDDPGIRDIISQIFSEEYEVVPFENASQFNAVLASGENNVHAMVMDVMLPDGNGLNLCSRVKSSPNFKNVPVLIMSAGLSFAEIERFSRADDFIPKPFDIDEMFRKVQRLTA
jgi:DNA-binding response OmpR family regulator